MKIRFSLLLIATLMLAACKQQPASQAKAPDTGPDNAMTRYGDALAGDLRRAQSAGDKANAAVHQEEQVGQEAAAAASQ